MKPRFKTLKALAASIKNGQTRSAYGEWDGVFLTISTEKFQINSDGSTQSGTLLYESTPHSDELIVELLELVGIKCH